MENTLERSERGIVLNVPFAEKDHVKRLGARWDPDMRRWFVPSGLETEPFSQWIGQGKGLAKKSDD